MIESLLKYQDVDAGLRKIELALSGSEARKKAVSAKKYLESVDETVNALDVKAAELAHIYENLQNESKILADQREEFVGALEHAEDENALNYLAKKADELYNKVINLAVFRILRLRGLYVIPYPRIFFINYLHRVRNLCRFLRKIFNLII